MDLEHDHSKKKIAERLMRPQRQSYLRDMIYGGIDGAVTTFAVVSGVVGGQLATIVILILGFANLVADGFSMAVSNYLGTKSELDLYKRYHSIEEKHIALVPEGEKEEIRQIFKNKGLTGEALQLVVDVITSNKPLWIKTMLQEEYGLPTTYRSPLKAGIITFLSFIIFGLIPLLPYSAHLASPFIWAGFSTGITFFLIGSIKSHWSLKSWWRSGIETLIIGTITAMIAYFIGVLLRLYLL